MMMETREKSSAYTEELAKFRGLISEQKWRLNNLYSIVDAKGELVPFKLNWAQEKLYDSMHKKNVVLKARQLGISTFMYILALDSCLFYSTFAAGIIDKTLPDATIKMEKIKLTWENLDNEELINKRWGEGAPFMLALMRKLKEIRGRKCGKTWEPVIDNVKELKFANGSKISVGTSYRGGTLQLLHISEYASICVESPKQAQKIKTGAYPAAQHGIIVSESTHEGGKWGANYLLCKNAMGVSNEERTDLDFKFWFFTWLEEPSYALPCVESYIFKEDTIKYFKELKETYNLVATREQMLWWERTEQTLGFAIRQEYPSVPDEAFEKANELAIYGRQMMRARTEGRIESEFNVDQYYPVYTFWDKGTADNGVVVFVQVMPTEYRFIDYIQCSGVGLVDYYAPMVRQKEVEHNFRVRTHYLPHDFGTNDGNIVTGKMHLEKAGLGVLHIMRRTPNVWDGVNALRAMLLHCRFHKRCGVSEDEDKYPNLITCLEQYSSKLVAGSEVTNHDIFSHVADACRYVGEANLLGLLSPHEYGHRDDNNNGGNWRKNSGSRGGLAIMS